MLEPVLAAAILAGGAVLAAVIHARSNRRIQEAIERASDEVKTLKVEVDGHMEELLRLTSDEGYAAGERHERERDHSEDEP